MALSVFTNQHVPLVTVRRLTRLLSIPPVPTLVQAFIVSPWITASSTLPLRSSQKLPLSVYPAAQERILAPRRSNYEHLSLAFFQHSSLTDLVRTVQPSTLHAFLPLYVVLLPQRMSLLPHPNPNRRLRPDSSYASIMKFSPNHLIHTHMYTVVLSLQLKVQTH